MKEFLARLTSRKFLATVGVVAFAVLGVVTGQMGFDQALEVAKTAVMTYIFAEGGADLVSRFKTT